MKQKMNSKMKTTVAYALMVSLISCSGMSDHDKTVRQGETIGAVSGGLLGGLTGWLVSKNSSSSETKAIAPLIGTVVGAGAGWWLGNKWGESVALKKECYVRSEDATKACIGDLDKRIQLAGQEQKGLQDTVRQLKSQKAGYGSSPSLEQKKEYNQQITSISQDVNQKIQFIDQDLASAKIAKSNAVGDGKVQEYNRKIAELNKQKTAFRSSLAELNKQSYRHVS